MLARRRAFPPEERAHAGAAIRTRAASLSLLRDADNIMLYASTAEEIDLFPLMETLLAQGRHIALPAITGKGMMEARALSAMDALTEGAFGILTPDAARGSIVSPDMLDLVIVPGAAFAPDGRRLGLGGGYYDRFLPRAGNAVRLVLAFDWQLVPDVPAGGRDARVDVILTERRFVDCRSGIMENLEEEV